MRRSLWLALLFFLSCASSVYALDDIQGVNAVWSDFVASLRRGDYPNAHGLFSPQSRLALPYREFVAEYGPLSAARELVLAKPDSQAAGIDGDWAEITYGGVNPDTGRPFRVGVSLVRNRGAWGLVAARNEAAERLEAGARSMLRLLWENRMHGKPRDLAAALTRGQADNPVLKKYRLEADGETFRAFPLERSLRTFYVDGWGEVRAVGDDAAAGRGAGGMGPMPERSAMARPPAEERRPAENAGAMPELSEPGNWDAAAGPEAPPADFLEPPMPAGPGNPSRPPAPPSVHLPDSIR